MTKLIKNFFLVFFLVFLIYLCLPPAEIPPLPDSLKSDEPGDTVQIPGVFAYYTDISRPEVVDFYQKALSRSAFLNLPLPTIVLNHPPEHAQVVIRDTTKSTFFYEIVRPFRDSLFVNGWDPAEDPQFKHLKDPGQVLLVKGRFYQRKVTLREMGSGFLGRILVFLLGIGGLVIVFKQLKKSIISLARQIK
jgi:hypothetical protein